MSSGPMIEPVIACVPGAIPAGERAAHFALAARIFNELAISRSPLHDGYEVRFPVEALTSVAVFVVNERLCCPFMRFGIELQPGASEIVLRMTGPAGTREVFDVELRKHRCDASECGCHAA